MTLDEAIIEWKSKKRRMGCVSAAKFLCQRVKGFYPKRIDRYTQNGEVFQHVVATDGVVVVDLVPHLDKADEPI